MGRIHSRNLLMNIRFSSAVSNISMGRNYLSERLLVATVKTRAVHVMPPLVVARRSYSRTTTVVRRAMGTLSRWTRRVSDVGEFAFSMPRGVLFNRNMLGRLPKTTKGLKKGRNFVVSNPALGELNMIKRYRRVLARTNVTIDAFYSARKGPSIRAIRHTTRTFQRDKTSFVITLNNNSPVSITGTMNIITGCNNDVARCRNTSGIPKRVVPLVTVPAATKANSRIATFSIVASRGQGCGLAMFSCGLVPTCTLLSPLLLVSTPTSITTTYKVSTLVRTRRSCISLSTSPFSRTVDRGTVRLVKQDVHACITSHDGLRTTSSVLTNSLFTKVTFS